MDAVFLPFSSLPFLPPQPAIAQGTVTLFLPLGDRFHSADRLCVPGLMHQLSSWLLYQLVKALQAVSSSLQFSQY